MITDLIEFMRRFLPKYYTHFKKVDVYLLLTQNTAILIKLPTKISITFKMYVRIIHLLTVFYFPKLH